MKYFIHERETGFAVKGQGNQKASNTELTEKQAERRAHDLAKRDGNPHVEWVGPDGKFRCSCPICTANRN
jgi:uncharacterized protein DUF2188